jgi:hypothetical protein
MRHPVPSSLVNLRSQHALCASHAFVFSSGSYACPRRAKADLLDRVIKRR